MVIVWGRKADYEGMILQMSEIKTKSGIEHNQDIDITELFQIARENKLIVAVTALLFSFAGWVVPIPVSTAPSEITVGVSYPPPGTRVEVIFSDFETLFYDGGVFEEWKKENKTTKILFEQFSPHSEDGGSIFATEAMSRLAEVQIQPPKPYTIASLKIKIKTGHRQVIDDFFDYTTYVSNRLNKEYLNLIEAEMETIWRGSTSDFKNLRYLGSLHRFISTNQKASKVFKVYRPTKPLDSAAMTNRSAKVGIALGAFGAFVGLLVALARHRYWRKNEV